jgi:mono/diheme cytochrome c family protein
MLAGAGMLLPLLAAGNSFGASDTDSQDFTQIERGRYLVVAADCAACHTVPNHGQPFAGGRPIETPFGNITSANITPDRDTGIGAWSDDDFDNALRKGIRPDGARLYPAMPYTAYTKMSQHDVLAIRAYLKTVAPVRNPVVTNTLPFPFDIRAVMRGWNWLYFTAGEYQPDPQKSSEWNRGAFLVQGPGHCTACHTPKSFLGGDKRTQYLRGSEVVRSSDASTLIRLVLRGARSVATAAEPTSPGMPSFGWQLDDAQVAAVATYVRNAWQPAAPAVSAGDVRRARSSLRERTD